MAALEPIGQMIKSAQGGTPEAITDRDRVRHAVAKLYAAGLTRSKIARKCQKWLITPAMKDRPADQRQKQALQKLKRWELQDSFRDLVWHYATVQLDLQSHKILRGVARKAESGRVDAARLALEVTGRHNPKGDGQPTAVVIQVNGIPRPQATGPTEEEIIDGVAEELED